MQVWQTAPSTFCAVVHYLGDFVTMGGPSPSGSITNLSSGITGTFEGGYRGVITGTLKTQPDYKTKGNIGTFDYNLEVPVVSILAAYFEPGYTFEYAFWGWIYNAGDNGTWVNAETSTGDIHN
jgi:hypothetical protein